MVFPIYCWQVQYMVRSWFEIILYILERSFFGEEMLTKSDIAGGSAKFVSLIIFVRTDFEDLSCRFLIF